MQRLQSFCADPDTGRANLQGSKISDDMHPVSDFNGVFGRQNRLRDNMLRHDSEPRIPVDNPLERINETDSPEELARRNAALTAEIEELRQRRKKYAELSAESTRLREENEALQLENKRVLAEIAERSSAEFDASQLPESRLRVALTTRSTTTAELQEAILAVESVVDEARRELAASLLRDRRAAFERLYAAIAADDDELGLEDAIEQAREAQLDAEDIEKGVKKLDGMRSMSLEERSAKLERQNVVRRKRDAFLHVKRDDVGSLRSLIEEIDERVRWQEWKDYAGRTLWRCSQDLHASRVQEYLAPKLGLPISKEVDVKPRYSRTSIAPAPQEEDAREKPRRQSVEHPRRVSHDLRRVSVDGSTNAPAPVAKTVSRDNSERQLGANHRTPDRVQGRRNAIKKKDPAPSEVQKTAPPVKRTTIVNLLPEDVGEPSSSSRTIRHQLTKANLVEDFRAKALRAVAQNDCDTLGEVLSCVSVDEWSKWENKAGQNLVTLSEVRRSSGAYAMLAGAMGLLKELPRQSFEEKETVWVFEQGEVMPRRATVLEVTAQDAETVPVEFWDGDAPSVYVERCLVRKMQG